MESSSADKAKSFTSLHQPPPSLSPSSSLPHSMSTFNPTAPFDDTKEREWAATLGMLDWDTTKIIFTKRTLLEFLKYTGTTVDTNFGNISKLPRYAKFGTIVGDVAMSSSSTQSAPAAEAQDDAFKPTRRVRDPPGGKTHLDIFGGTDQEDALATAPPLPRDAKAVITSQPAKEEPVKEDDNEEYGLDLPSSRSRQNTTQHKSTGSGPLSTNFWDQEPEEYKPTRRVRETPGGKDNIQFGV